MIPLFIIAHLFSIQARCLFSSLRLFPLTKRVSSFAFPTEMSRHQAYRNLNVYTELEDYDYRDEDDYEDEQHDNHRDRLGHS